MTIKLDPQKGLSVPSLTTTERNNIVSPEDGALVFDVDLDNLFAYVNGSWAPVSTGTLPTSDWEAGTSTTESLVSPAKIRDAIPPALNATGSAPVYACRAWVNFDGTGTVSIRNSGNVSSITDNGTGQYTVNFATAMPDVDYVPQVQTAGDSGTVFQGVVSGSLSGGATSQLAGSIRIDTGFTNTSNALYDIPNIYVAIFR